MHPFTPPSPSAPFDLGAVKSRNAEFARNFLHTMLAPHALEADLERQKRMSDQLVHVMTDGMASTAEIKRLYDRFEQLQRRHMPLAGEPGAPAVCTGCSMHGAQVPWPCEVYTFAAKSLPERR